ncbi:PIG-L deacetylase family protein [Vibrio splendidus]|uniref:PIG-L deacetylase family protein n=1 Tax=Vibrio splendidus TaxID=29497 RepID=UPI00352CF0A0
MINNCKKALVLAPHTDDGELGMGATISKLIREGVEVHYAAFSPAIESIPKGFSPDSTRLEVTEATKLLGIRSENLYIYDFEVRIFPEKRQEILDNLISLRNKVDPDVIFIPSSDDVHQDHSVIHTEAVRAFKNRTIFCYELIWNQFSFNSHLLISLDREDVEKKYNALSCYKTQSGRPYMDKDFIFGLSKARGVQVGVDFAEAFEVIRCVIK